MAIAKALQSIDSSAEVKFVSYSTGASTLRSGGWDLIDLNLPADNGFLPTLLCCSDVIRRENPTVVIAHEEFSALVAARLAFTPAIFISAWLPQSPGVAFDSMAYANAAIIFEAPGIFSTPASMRVRPVFVGPLARQTRYSPDDRSAARQELGIEPGSVVVSVIPGGGATEKKAPLFGTVLDAFQRIQSESKRLYWLGGPDAADLRAATGLPAGVQILDHQPDIDRILVSSDVVVTKGTRGATYDAAMLGVPSISLSFGLNPIDDLLVPRIKSNLSLNGRAVSGELLHRYLMECVRGNGPGAGPQVVNQAWTTHAEVAQLILAMARQFSAAQGVEPRAE